MSLREKAHKLPEGPGIYIMQDEYGNIIYIGKAKNLRSRVSQYFRSSKNHSPKVLKMVGNIRSFDYISVDTELEALLLECRLIKDLKPMYNSQLKNDLGYVYLRLSSSEEFPGFEASIEKNEEGVFFGPYAKEKSVERALNVLQDYFQIRHCRSFSVKNAGCARYQLGLCTAPCAGEIGQDEYKKRIDDIIGFLEERKPDIVSIIEDKMTAAAETLDFDRAARYRDDARALRLLAGRQQAIDFNRKNRSIAAIEKVNDEEIKLFIVKGSSIVYKRKFTIVGVDRRELKGHIREFILSYVKDDTRASELSKQDIDQAQILYSYLKNKKGCSYMLIPISWIKKSNMESLEQGIERLITKAGL